ncbi:MAG: hypothetical protein E7262_02375 [Lachnospiraceae bacterium]|nr:hypothetical protein [Lachnospiraceae bacterium]
MNKQKTKTIYILLTRTTTVVSRAVHLLTADDYTHVSISFNKKLQPLYSSSRKNGRTIFPAGPCKESFKHGYLRTHRNIPCAVYELHVSEEVYERAKHEVEKVMKHADDYHFNIIGLLLCRFNIAYNRKKNYFCSQFVSEVLKRSRAIKLPKEVSLMRPSDYMELPELALLFRGKLNDFIRKVNKQSAMRIE